MKSSASRVLKGALFRRWCWFVGVVGVSAGTLLRVGLGRRSVVDRCARVGAGFVSGFQAVCVSRAVMRIRL